MFVYGFYVLLVRVSVSSFDQVFIHSDAFE